jgi:hypothetical protein
MNNFTDRIDKFPRCNVVIQGQPFNTLYESSFGFLADFVDAEVRVLIWEGIHEYRR